MIEEEKGREGGEKCEELKKVDEEVVRHLRHNYLLAESREA